MRPLYWKLGAVAVLLLVAFLYVQSVKSKAAAEAVAASQVKQAEQVAEMWQKRYEAKSAELQAVSATAKDVIVEYQKQRPGVRFVRDTLIQIDSVTVLVTPEYIAAADSVASTCSLLSATCDAFRLTSDSTLAARDYVISGMAAQVRAAKKYNLMQKVSIAVLFGSVGYLVGSVSK